MLIAQVYSIYTISISKISCKIYLSIIKYLEVFLTHFYMEPGNHYYGSSIIANEDVKCNIVISDKSQKCYVPKRTSNTIHP